MRVVAVMMALTSVAIADSQSKVGSATTAQHVIADALVTKGGQKLSAFRRYRIVTTGTVKVPRGDEITIDLEHVVLDDQERIDVRQSNTQSPGTTVVDGVKSWRIRPPCPCAKTQSGPTLEDLSDSDMYWMELERWRDPDLILLRAAEPDAQITTAPDARIDGRPHAVVKVRAPDGVDVRLYIDKQTKLLSRTKFDDPRVVAGRPIGSRVEDYSEYKDIGGLQIAHKRLSTNRFGTSTIEISSMELDPVVDPNLFKRPDSPHANRVENVPSCASRTGDR